MQPGTCTSRRVRSARRTSSQSWRIPPTEVLTFEVDGPILRVGVNRPAANNLRDARYGPARTSTGRDGAVLFWVLSAAGATWGYRAWRRGSVPGVRRSSPREV